MRLVAVRIERPAQPERPVGVAARGDGGQPEGSVRLPGAHPHNVGVPWRPRRVAAAATVAVVAGFRVVARRGALQPQGLQEQRARGAEVRCLVIIGSRVP